MRFRFTIRDLLWLTALVAMGLGWWINQRYLISKAVEDQHRQMEAAEKAQMELIIKIADYARAIGELQQRLRKAEAEAPNTQYERRYQAQINDLKQRIKEMNGGPTFRLAPTIVTEKPDNSGAGQ